MENYLARAEEFATALKRHVLNVGLPIKINIAKRDNCFVVGASINDFDFRYWFFADVFENEQVEEAKSFINGFARGVKYAKYCHEN